MSEFIYLKQLLADGSGKYQIIRVKPASRDTLLADDWQDSSEEEWRQQFADRTAPIDSAADKALGEKPAEGEGEAQAEGEAKEEAKVEEGKAADTEAAAETKPDAES